MIGISLAGVSYRRLSPAWKEQIISLRLQTRSHTQWLAKKKNGAELRKGRGYERQGLFVLSLLFRDLVEGESNENLCFFFYFTLFTATTSEEFPSESSGFHLTHALILIQSDVFFLVSSPFWINQNIKTQHLKQMCSRCAVYRTHSSYTSHGHANTFIKTSILKDCLDERTGFFH